MQEKQQPVTRTFQKPNVKSPAGHVFVKQMPKGVCSYCDEEREKGNDFFPYHTASRYCQSGGRDHCTCDLCF